MNVFYVLRHYYRTTVSGIKYAVQRATRGYSTRDVWDFDKYLAYIIAEGCRHLRIKGVSHPSDISWAEWSKTLWEIEEGFRTYLDVMNSAVEYNDQNAAKIAEAKELLITFFEDLWD